MRVSALRRHVVKSLQGQVVGTAEIGVDGLDSDRCWGVRDEVTGKILTGRRALELLHARATLTDGVPRMTLPTGETCEGPGPETDAALTRWLGKPVALVSSAGAPGARAEYFADATDDSSTAIEWQMPAGRSVRGRASGARADNRQPAGGGRAPSRWRLGRAPVPPEPAAGSARNGLARGHLVRRPDPPSGRGRTGPAPAVHPLTRW
jgi:hypothetical protein